MVSRFAGARLTPSGSPRSERRYRRLLLLASALVLWPTALLADHGTPGELTAADYADEARLADLLWTHSPDVLDARTATAVAAGEVTRARTLPNPALDFTWGTIPIGRTNPSDLHDPLGNVPNYAAGISELVEIGKRGPRQAATVAELERSKAQALAALATRFFDLLDAIGKIAKSQYRAAVMSDLVAASEDLLGLDRIRAAKGDMAAMDVDRAEVEHMRLLESRDAALSELEAARGECGAIVATPCAPFESAHLARRFLEKMVSAALPESWTPACEQRRPDIAALDATLQAAAQRRTLAERRAIPDVTVRLGYTYDTFLAAGNQEQSLALGLQVPLPVFDQGQADRQAAAATLVHAANTRRSLVEAGRLALAAAVRQRELVSARIHQLDAALSKARAVSDTVEGATKRGGASMADVLLARRAYRELSLERVELDGAAYEATLKVRQTVALFAHPGGESDLEGRSDPTGSGPAEETPTAGPGGESEVSAR